MDGHLTNFRNEHPAGPCPGRGDVSGEMGSVCTRCASSLFSFSSSCVRMLINSFECLNGKGIKTRANDKGPCTF